MNTGIFGEGFPYSNFHDLNMDWIIKIAKDFLDQYTHIQEVIAEGEQSLTDLTETGLQELQDKYENLETLLQQWYDTHSSDIANELADALQDISTALTNAVTSFGQQATAKAQEVIATIPEDYTALSNQVTLNERQLHHTTGNEIAISYGLKIGDMVLGGVDSGDGHLFPDVTRARSTLLPLHSGQVIYNFNNLLYEFGVYKFDRFGNYVSYSVWHTEFYPITDDGLYYIVMRTPNSDNLTSIIDTIANGMTIQDLDPTAKIKIDANADGGYFFDKNNLVQGQFYYCIPQSIQTNRIRPEYLIPVKAGDNVGLLPNGFEIYCSIYESDDATTAVESHTWASAITHFIIEHDGYMAINIRKIDQSNITPSDFTGYISVTHKKTNEIVVDINGNGDTTSFAWAVLMAYTIPNTTIYVKPGTYNVLAEMESIFGNGYFENMQSTYFLVQGLPWGNGMKIIGSRGSIIRFDASNITNTIVHHDFSILNAKYVDNGNTMINSIEGCYFWATNIKYCVHMDQGAVDNYNTFLIKNNTMLMDNSGNTEILASNCIGMGASIHTLYVIESNFLNSIFSSNARDNETIYYHNTNDPVTDNKLIVKDNYFGGLGTIRVDAYGDSHNRSLVQINGNSVGSALLLNNNAGNDNLRFAVWNNEVR